VRLGGGTECLIGLQDLVKLKPSLDEWKRHVNQEHFGLL
jgi:hypothetical protein